MIQDNRQSRAKQMQLSSSNDGSCILIRVHGLVRNSGHNTFDLHISGTDTRLNLGLKPMQYECHESLCNSMTLSFLKVIFCGYYQKRIKDFKGPMFSQLWASPKHKKQHGVRLQRSNCFSQNEFTIIMTYCMISEHFPVPFSARQH
jgi:hypothetical protein